MQPQHHARCSAQLGILHSSQRLGVTGPGLNCLYLRSPSTYGCARIGRASVAKAFWNARRAFRGDRFERRARGDVTTVHGTVLTVAERVHAPVRCDSPLLHSMSAVCVVCLWLYRRSATVTFQHVRPNERPRSLRIHGTHGRKRHCRLY